MILLLRMNILRFIVIPRARALRIHEIYNAAYKINRVTRCIESITVVTVITVFGVITPVMVLARPVHTANFSAKISST